MEAGKGGRPGYEPFEVAAPKRSWLNRVDRRMRRALPRRAYTSLLAGYHVGRRLVGRNPGRGRMLPDFVIIGAAKSGTTTLYAWLCSHPCVAPARAKEIHYFSFHHYRGADWYRQHFPLHHQANGNGCSRVITGEASPSYLLDPQAPARMAQLLPDAKLIVALREPVARAYSQFQMRRRDGEEPCESFLHALALEDPALRAPDLGIDPPPDDVTGRSYLARGRYAEQLERWLAHYPREQFHFVLIDDLATRPREVLAAVHEFLDLPEHAPDEMSPLYVGDYDPLPARERELVADYFRPHNARLSALLGRDLGWDAPGGASRP